MFPAMMARLLAVALLAWAACGAAADAQTAGAQAPARNPVVVELYTSQGCWECARANRFAGALAREQGVLSLTFPVGYWDYLGWNDTFAQPEYSDRQRDYAARLRGRRSTPQLVIDGERQVSASDWDTARASLQQVQSTPRLGGANVSIRRLGGSGVRVIVGAGTPGQTADIWLVAFEPGPLPVNVTSGENAHRTVWHYNLVRWIRRIGGWDGSASYVEYGRCAPECAVLVQAPNGGPILAAAYTDRRRR